MRSASCTRRCSKVGSHDHAPRALSTRPIVDNSKLNPLENKSQAQKWRATALATYGRCREWTLFDSPVPSGSISRYRQKYYEAVAKEIDSIIDPIARKHFPDRNDHDNRFQRSMVFIEAAGDLGVMLGKQAADLRIMDKSWFERSERVFVCDDERMKGRLAEEDDDLDGGLRVDLVLRPGFLKYGNDEGENLENYAVWIPAMLDLSELTHSETEGEDTPEEEVEPPAEPTQPEVADAFIEKQDSGSLLSNMVAKLKGVKFWKGGCFRSGACYETVNKMAKRSGRDKEDLRC